MQNHLRRSLLILAVLLMATAAFAKEVRYKEMPLDIKPGEHLAISCFHCIVHLTQMTQGQTPSLKARKFTSDKASSDDLAKLDTLSFTVKHEGAALVIESKPPDSKQGWVAMLKSPGPELEFDINAQSVPVEVMEREGQVFLQSWNQPASISVVTGLIHTSSTEGALKVQLQRGDIRVEKHHGQAEVDSYGAKLVVQDMEGDLDLTNFGGESSLTGIHGHVGVQIHAGSLGLAKSSGSLEFLNGRGSLNVQGFDGPIHGQTDQGIVVAAVEGETEVNIESNQGPVTVHLPAKSGALIHLESEEGALAAPEPVRIVNAASRRTANGRLAGTGAKGSVAVKSKSGAIRIRY
jgi:hypothetical protein